MVGRIFSVGCHVGLYDGFAVGERVGFAVGERVVAFFVGLFFISCRDELSVSSSEIEDKDLEGTANDSLYFVNIIVCVLPRKELIKLFSFTK
jgi:hypothetical protein